MKLRDVQASQKFRYPVSNFFFLCQMIMNVMQTVLWRHLGDEIPHVYSISKNVSFILQNAHFSVSYPRPYMPNVAEIACIHCRDAQPLPKVS